MIGFYLNLQIKPSSDIIVRILNFGQFLEIGSLEENCLYLFSDKNQQQIAQSGEISLYAVGTVIYRERWGNKALSVIMQELNGGADIEDIARTLRGQFCLIVANNKEIIVITDRLASFPVYKLDDDRGIQISNILPCMLKHNKLTINPQETTEYICLGFCFTGTFIKEIERLKMATIFKLGEKTGEIKYAIPFENIEFNKYKNVKEAADTVTKVILNNLSFLNKHDKIYADVTGGFDTRTIATLLRSKDYTFTGGMCPDPIIHFSYKVSNEIIIAKEVCKALGVEYNDSFRIEDYDSFLEVLKLQLAITSGVPIPFCNADYVNYFNQISKNYSVHIAGYVGSQIFKQEMKKLNLFSPKFNIKSQIGKRYRYLDIFNGDFNTQKRFQNSITEKFREWLKDIGTDKFKHSATYLSVFGYSKGWHGTLMNTHTCLLPVYAPFYDPECIKVMMETDYNIKKQHSIQKQIIYDLNPEVGSIMTTHGYNADPGSKNKIGNIKAKGKDMIRPLIYHSRSLTKLRRRLEKYMYPAVDTDEFEESYWEKYVNKHYTDNMKIYSFVSKDKLEKNVLSLPKKRKQTILARLVFMDNMIDKYNIG